MGKGHYMSLYAVVDPATGDVVQEYPTATDAQIEEAIAAAADAYREWGRTTTVAERVRQQNAIFVALASISTAQDHLIDKRAAGGARLAGIDEAAALREATSVTLKTTLSDLRDVNIAEAASRLAQQSTALDAAQLSFQRIASLSLFNYLR